jgi:type II secretion system protein H
MRVRAGNLSGFTLVELMVVIIVIGIVTSVMVAEMSGTFEDALLKSNARKLIDVCDAASNRAIAARQTQILRIDPASGKFEVRGRTSGEEANEQAEIPTAIGELDSRVALVVREPQTSAEANDNGEEPREADPDSILFYPDGTADSREFVFRDRAGVELLLRINPVTSRVRIIEAKAE